MTCMSKTLIWKQQQIAIRLVEIGLEIRLVEIGLEIQVEIGLEIRLVETWVEIGLEIGLEIQVEIGLEIRLVEIGLEIQVEIGLEIGLVEIGLEIGLEIQVEIELEIRVEIGLEIRLEIRHRKREVGYSTNLNYEGHLKNQSRPKSNPINYSRKDSMSLLLPAPNSTKLVHDDTLVGMLPLNSFKHISQSTTAAQTFRQFSGEKILRNIDFKELRVDTHQINRLGYLRNPARKLVLKQINRFQISQREKTKSKKVRLDKFPKLLGIFQLTFVSLIWKLFNFVGDLHRIAAIEGIKAKVQETELRQAPDSRRNVAEKVVFKVAGKFPVVEDADGVGHVAGDVVVVDVDSGDVAGDDVRFQCWRVVVLPHAFFMSSKAVLSSVGRFFEFTKKDMDERRKKRKSSTVLEWKKGSFVIRARQQRGILFEEDERTIRTHLRAKKFVKDFWKTRTDLEIASDRNWGKWVLAHYHEGHHERREKTHMKPK
ncbi:hypothetical protein STAS_28951 [Striga asiatica]|uniref:Uncharacterized protein n=1 Tax=Striga asiatica TaxID=4170 RepID=A0A5A7R2D8_STRAF|nr:hypothetical protein STAS_28951 [Striga asiatica]